ncbi:hypothetical protein GGS21DRAFT_513340 [Xylaria nigripes]|nr:hypothetical protein GGS21DRAFT_513340 [Xylaria nigripes]
MDNEVGSSPNAANQARQPKVKGSKKAPLFPYFSRLPPSIRQEIWSTYLHMPHVVVLYSRSRKPTRECERDRLSLKLPRSHHAGQRQNVLSGVCRESRGMAFSIRGPSHMPPTYRFRRWISSNVQYSTFLATFMDPKLDWLCLDAPFHCKRVLDRNRAVVEESRELMLNAANIAFISRRGSWLRIRSIMNIAANKELFPQMEDLGLVCNIVTLHVEPGRAWAAGLFDYGETHALVDLDDVVRMRQFYDFYCNAHPSGGVSELLTFFRRLGYTPRQEGDDGGARPKTDWHHAAIKEMRAAWRVYQYLRLTNGEASQIRTFRQPFWWRGFGYDGSCRCQFHKDESEPKMEEGQECEYVEYGSDDAMDEQYDRLVVVDDKVCRRVMGKPPAMRVFVLFRTCGLVLTHRLPGSSVLGMKCKMWRR